MTNVLQLIVLSLTITTNKVPGDGTFKLVGDHIVGVKNIEYAKVEASIGCRLEGTNTMELFQAQKILWARTNTTDLPLLMGVGAPAEPQTLQPKAK